MKMRLFLCAAAVSLAAAATVRASSIDTVEGLVPLTSSTTAAASLDNDPVVIDTLLNTPGTYTKSGSTLVASAYWAFLVHDANNDSSMQVNSKMPTGNTYVPSVGDSIDATGVYSPYHQIPELEKLSAIAEGPFGSGQTTNAALLCTVSQIDTTTLPLSEAGFLIQLDNVTISNTTTSTVFGTSNLALGVTDSTGTETLYYWPTSYSACFTGLGGTAIPTSGTYDITGIASVYGGTSPEFTPISMTPVGSVPEPGTLALLAAGGAFALTVLQRRRRVRR
jgi:hypothetical protein